MNYKIVKVGRGVNAPKKRQRICKSCGTLISDFRVEEEGTYLCVHCLMSLYHTINKSSIKSRVAKWLIKNEYNKSIKRQVAGKSIQGAETVVEVAKDPE